MIKRSEVSVKREKVDNKKLKKKKQEAGDRKNQRQKEK